ncbi:16721_t:CDS:1, partial [Gigaspora rosea]
LISEYLEWQSKITIMPNISIDDILPNLYERYKKETVLDPWINSESSQTLTNTQH